MQRQKFFLLPSFHTPKIKLDIPSSLLPWPRQHLDVQRTSLFHDVSELSGCVFFIIFFFLFFFNVCSAGLTFVHYRAE